MDNNLMRAGSGWAGCATKNHDRGDSETLLRQKPATLRRLLTQRLLKPQLVRWQVGRRDGGRTGRSYCALA